MAWISWTFYSSQLYEEITEPVYTVKTIQEIKKQQKLRDYALYNFHYQKTKQYFSFIKYFTFLVNREELIEI